MQLKTVFLNLVLLGTAGAGIAYVSTHKAVAELPPSFRTAAVKRGDLLSTVSATGTVEPEEVGRRSAEPPNSSSVSGGGRGVVSGWRRNRDCWVGASRSWCSGSPTGPQKRH
jgi:multidrug efflux pump subunit AcrA (membrane-fusion protein)